MASQYSKEQLKKVYKTLPEPLKVALGSVEIQDEIDQICRENGLTDNTLIDQIYNVVMDIFMGFVLPENLEEEISKISSKSNSGEITHRIQRFIVFPLKAELIQMHNMRIVGQEQGVPTRERKQARELFPDPKDDYIATEEDGEEDVIEEPRPKQADQYREEVE